MNIGIVHGKLFLEHQAEPGHPENAERLSFIRSPLSTSRAKIVELPLVPATVGNLRRTHATALIRKLESGRGGRGWLDADTYYSPRSVDVALTAAGATIDLALRIWRRELRRGFALVRPPGHHATSTISQGFCLLNNVALAAAAILDESPQARIAIVDFDLHHGNGTQDIFYDDPRVLFISSHRYPFYPGTGGLLEKGHGAGKDTTFNFPVGLPHGDSFFRGLYHGMVTPVLEKFAPQIVLVSAGFDGHASDPMQGFRMSTELYGFLARELVSVAERKCEGKILFCLEGGYDPRALAASVEQVWKVLVSAEVIPDQVNMSDFPEWELYRSHFKDTIG